MAPPPPLQEFSARLSSLLALRDRNAPFGLRAGKMRISSLARDSDLVMPFPVAIEAIAWPTIQERDV
jgi:hypothetical protein